MLCGVGESPVWRVADQTFTWTDIPGKTLWPDALRCAARAGCWRWKTACTPAMRCWRARPVNPGCWPPSRTRRPACASMMAVATGKAVSWPARWSWI
ncbi:hypothetical protein G6F32_017104 [Rhizopus arrhizus]|nr:hypothetical protein G6F32_017104 [Rhizopus arrhizus]